MKATCLEISRLLMQHIAYKFGVLVGVVCCSSLFCGCHQDENAPAKSPATSPRRTAIASGQETHTSGPVDFYGKSVTLLKLFGQQRWGETSPGRVNGNGIFHAAGVLVDRGTQPHPIYVADTGNNRILGFRGFHGRAADIVLGQPDFQSGAANGDSNIGMYGPPGRETLCLTAFPAGTNTAEQWLRLNFDVDSLGNLYVPDIYNNRVLMYRAPLAKASGDGAGDTLPDFVWGQRDFTTNGINRGMGPKQCDGSSLYISTGGFDNVSARGVSVDHQGNLWVADTFNHRVLRFPPLAAKADLVLGQFDYSSQQCAFPAAATPAKAPLDRLCTPTLARVNPENGELFVVDEFPRGFPARILVFTPPFQSGMSASRTFVPRQRLNGDYANGYQLTHATGLVFNPVKTDDLIDPQVDRYRYRDGFLWLHDSGPDGRGKRTLLLDKNGEILLALCAIDRNHFGCSWEQYGRCLGGPEKPFNVGWPGGMIGFDNDNHIYLADEHWHRVARFALPYRYRRSDDDVCLPEDSGGLFPGDRPNSMGPANFHAYLGAIPFRDQLIVRDQQRYMVWNDYLDKPWGAPADVIVGQPTGDRLTKKNLIHGRAMHAIDDRRRLWTRSAHSRLLLYQLPLRADSKPLRELIPLFWADAPESEVDYGCDQALAFDHKSHMLWIFDNKHHRVLRIRNPDDWQGKLLVDAVIGQRNKLDGAVNRGQSRPDAASLGHVADIRFDNKGNLFVVDNNYEGHPNGRIVAFVAADLDAISSMFPDIHAKKLFVTQRFDQTDIVRIHDPVDHPFSPVSIAFNSRNEMVVGNDGYYRDPQLRKIRQIYLYRDPLKKQTPDAVIELPLGAAGELNFDQYDNLVVQDHTWSKTWVINYDRDPEWLHPLP